LIHPEINFRKQAFSMECGSDPVLIGANIDATMGQRNA
jgi:hypothetical protein